MFHCASCSITDFQVGNPVPITYLGHARCLAYVSANCSLDAWSRFAIAWLRAFCRHFTPLPALVAVGRSCILVEFRFAPIFLVRHAWHAALTQAPARVMAASPLCFAPLTPCCRRRCSDPGPGPGNGGISPLFAPLPYPVRSHSVALPAGGYQHGCRGSGVERSPLTRAARVRIPV